jgi:acetyl esterase/lipase
VAYGPCRLHMEGRVVTMLNRILPLAVATAVVLASCGSADDATTPLAATTPVADTTTTVSIDTTALATTTIVTITTPAPVESAPPGDPSAVLEHPVADDVAYAPISDLQRLDIYSPTQGKPPYPVVVIIHGGGWTMGDKRGELPLAAIPGFLALGFAVASINYRLAPDAVFPAQLLDVKAAIRYLRHTATEFGLDPDRIAVVGESAGAHLAALLGTTQGLAEFDDPALGNPDVSSDVHAVVDFYGPADLTTSDAQRALNPPCPAEPDPNIGLLLGASPAEAPDVAAAASPITYLQPGRDVPPFFIAHGDVDCVVPHQQSVELHEAIEAVAPGRSQLTIVPGSGHYVEFDFQSINQALTAFLNETVGTPPSS